jgi:hypothetical protein
MVRPCGGSRPNPGSMRRDGSFSRGTWAHAVTGPAEATQRQVRLSSSPVAQATVCPLLEYIGSGFFLQQ